MASIQSGITLLTGAASPEGAVIAVVGSLYMQTGGTDAGTLWSKVSGTGNAGWTKIAPPGGTGTPSTGNQWFVATTGSASNIGTQASPWTLAFAKTGANTLIKAGDTVWIRGGSYVGNAGVFGHEFTVSGTNALPITYRGFPGERATLVGDAGFQSASVYTNANDVWFRDLEMVGGADGGSATRIEGTSNKLINCILHDGLSQAVAMQRFAIGTECYGNIAYNNGPCIGAHGCSGSVGAYGAYIQNNPPVPKLFQHNVFFNNTSVAAQLYGGGDPNFLQDITFDSNVLFGGSAISTAIASEAFYSGGPSNRINITNNHFYQLHMPSGERFAARLSADTPSATNFQVVGNRFYGDAFFEQQIVSGVVENNIFHSVGTVPQNGIVEILQTNHTYSSWSNNTHYRLSTDAAWRYFNTFSNFATWKASSGLGVSDTNPAAAPTGTEIVILPNRYESKRAIVVVYNWALAANAAVDLSLCGLASGDSYVVKNVQDFYGAAALSGTYAGGTVNVPMAAITPPTTLYGRTYNAPPATGPQFQVFVVRLASA